MSALLILTVMAFGEMALDPNVLTLGFARRFTAYKRTGLLLSDRARLARLLCDAAHPAQLVIAGKAHPDDTEGKQMIQEWIEFAQDPRHRRCVAFLEGYDISLAQEMVLGVDVWINTPRHPWEACGTSGMKVLVKTEVLTCPHWTTGGRRPGRLTWAGRSATTSRPTPQNKTAAMRRRFTARWSGKWCPRSMTATLPASRAPGWLACDAAWPA